LLNSGSICGQLMDILEKNIWQRILILTPVLVLLWCNTTPVETFAFYYSILLKHVVNFKSKILLLLMY